MESHYLTKETKQQTKTGTTTQKSYAMHSAATHAAISTEYNILWLKNDYLWYCSSTNRHTKNFFIRKKSFSFDFLYCYLEWHRIPKRGGKPIILPIGILELGLAEKYENWYIFSALMQQWVGISFGCKALD